MARGRMISKSLSTSKKYAALNKEPLGEFCQALYPLLVAHADDFGRLEGDVFTVHHAVIPSSKRDETEIQQALSLLDRVQLVAWYEVGGSHFLQVIDFERHQSGLHKRTSSRFPRVPGKYRKVSAIPLEEKGTELKGTEQKGTRAAASPPSSGKPENHYAVILKTAHDAIDIEGEQASLSTLKDAVKSLCMIREIDYGSNSAVINKAIDSALVQRKRKHA